MTPNLDTSLDSLRKPDTAAERRSSSWDIRNAPRNYISLLIYQFGSALFSFGAVWIITRYLGSEGYGGIVAIIAASQVAQVFVNWTGIGVVRFGVDEFIETEKIARAFWFRLSVLAINLVFLAALSYFWFPPLADWLKLAPDSFWLVMAHFAVTAGWIHVQMSLQGAKLMRVQGLLQMVERFIIFAGLFGLTAAARLTPDLSMICYIAGPALVMFFGLFVLRTYVIARFAFDRAFVERFVVFSLPLLPFSLVGYFSGSYVDAIFVSNFLSTRDLGIYSVATQINGIALQLPTLANTLLLPLFVTIQSESDDQRGSNYFRHVLPSLTLSWGLGCSIMAFVAYFAIPVFFGEEFQPAGMPLWVLLAASTIGIPVAIGYSALSNAASATYISLVAAVLSSITNVSANFVLIPRYGLVGCAVATAIAFFVSVVVFAFLTSRQARIPISWTFIAFAPSIAGALLASVLDNVWLGVTVCIAGSFLIACLFRRSLNKTLAFRKNFLSS